MFGRVLYHDKKSLKKFQNEPNTLILFLRNLHHHFIDSAYLRLRRKREKNEQQLKLVCQQLKLLRQKLQNQSLSKKQKKELKLLRQQLQNQSLSEKQKELKQQKKELNQQRKNLTQEMKNLAQLRQQQQQNVEPKYAPQAACMKKKITFHLKLEDRLNRKFPGVYSIIVDSLIRGFHFEGEEN